MRVSSVSLDNDGSNAQYVVSLETDTHEWLVSFKTYPDKSVLIRWHSAFGVREATSSFLSLEDAAKLLIIRAREYVDNRKD